MAGEQHSYLASRISLHATAQLQPIEQRRHPQSGPPFANPNFTGNAILGNPSQWFNPRVVAAAAEQRLFGNLTRDNLTGPGLTWDFSAIKNTTLHERLSLQFRAEILTC